MFIEAEKRLSVFVKSRTFFVNYINPGICNFAIRETNTCTPDLNCGGKVTWTVDVLEPATFSVDLTLRGEGRGVWKVETDEGHSAQNQQGVSSIFCKRPIGWISFDKPGRHTITVSMPEGGNPSELSAISLTPVRFE